LLGYALELYDIWTHVTACFSIDIFLRLFLYESSAASDFYWQIRLASKKLD